MIRSCNSGFGEWYKPWTWGNSDTVNIPPSGAQTSAELLASQYEAPIGPVKPASAYAEKPKIIRVPEKMETGYKTIASNPMNMLLGVGILGMLGIGWALINKKKH